MAITLDATTWAEYQALTIASQRATLIRDALTSPVTVGVYRSQPGGPQLMGSGVMLEPWCSVSGSNITIGEVNSSLFSVAVAGVPDGQWYLRFTGANGRYVQGGFGLSGTLADFRWSLSSFVVGGKGTIGTAVLTTAGVANGPPVWAFVPTITFVQGTASNASVAALVSDPDGDPITITHNGAALPAGVTFNSALKRYEYNGTGPVAGTDGHVLTADDGTSGTGGTGTDVTIVEQPATTISVARGATVTVARAYRADNAPITATFIFASTGAPRSIPDLTISYTLSAGVYSVRVTASASATLTTYTDFGLEIA